MLLLHRFANKRMRWKRSLESEKKRAEAILRGEVVDPPNRRRVKAKRVTTRPPRLPKPRRAAVDQPPPPSCAVVMDKHADCVSESATTSTSTNAVQSALKYDEELDDFQITEKNDSAAPSDSELEQEKKGVSDNAAKQNNMSSSSLCADFSSTSSFTPLSVNMNFSISALIASSTLIPSSTTTTSKQGQPLPSFYSTYAPLLDFEEELVSTSCSSPEILSDEMLDDCQSMYSNIPNHTVFRI